MSKQKLRFFAELKEMENVVELNDEQFPAEALRGNWRKRFFKNKHPLCLELACGKGEYTNALAQKYPDINFIGIDIKGGRINRGAKEASALGLKNVMFLRIQIEHLSNYFAAEEVNELWITFPEPHLRSRDNVKRLTAPRFLDDYKKVLAKDHLIHLKSDSSVLYDFTLIQIEERGHNLLEYSADVYKDYNEDSDLRIVQTAYEKMYIADMIPIKYIKFTL
jgi:tRNA (guanine-N7-)-methyltransferase